MPNRNRVRPQLHFLFFCTILLLTGCNSQTQELEQLEQASRSYKEQRDYVSLEIIHWHLRKGMVRTKVEELLGEADYSPIEGQDYYSSDRHEAERRGEEQIDTPVGLVVDYQDEQGVLTDRLQEFRLGRIGE